MVTPKWFSSLVRAGLIVACFSGSLVLNACNVVYGATLQSTTSLQPTTTSTPFLPEKSTPASMTTPVAPAVDSQPVVSPTPAARVLEVPILLYHHIAASGADQRYYVSPAVFEKQMQWLADHGYHTITEARLADVIRNGGTLPERPVIISFDDGNADFFTGAFAVMNRLNMVGVAFLVTNRIDKSGSVSSDQIKALIKSGWEIGDHTMSHPDLLGQTADLRREMLWSKIWLEMKFGIQVVSFAYPFGSMDDSIAQTAAEDGYTSAARLGGRIQQSQEDLYFLGRTEIRGDYSMTQFEALMPWK